MSTRIALLPQSLQSGLKISKVHTSSSRVFPDSVDSANGFPPRKNIGMVLVWAKNHSRPVGLRSRARGLNVIRASSEPGQGHQPIERSGGATATKHNRIVASCAYAARNDVSRLFAE